MTILFGYHLNFISKNMTTYSNIKLSEIFAVIIGILLEYGASYIELGIDLHLTNIISTYICAMELISIIENICEVNPTLGKLFKPYLEKLKGEYKDDE